MLNADQLQRLGIGAEWVDPLNQTFQRFGLDNALRQAGFIGQCAHESKNFHDLEEGLTYKTAARLMAIFPRRFPTIESATPFINNPKALGNKIYANRMGNRDEASGDGYRFRGRGLLQCTGSDLYYKFGKAINMDFWADPDLLATPTYAALSAGWFWDTHKLNALADARDWTKMTKVINGGTIGLEHRIAAINKAIEVL